MGYTKYSNWKSGVLGHVAAPTVFFGDNGQGDFAAAQMMLLRSQTEPMNKGRVVAAFIHDVAQTCLSDECRTTWAEQNIFFFANYGEAADIAKNIGLVSEERSTRVIAEVKRKMSVHKLKDL